MCMCLSLDECVPGYRPASNSLQRTHALPNKKILEESAPHAYLQQPQLIPSSHPLTSAPSHSIPSTSTHPLIRFMVERSYGTRYQSGSFSLIYVESASHCPRKEFFILFSSHMIRSNNADPTHSKRSSSRNSTVPSSATS